MAEADAHVHKGPSYMAIFVWLTVLTVLEIGAFYIPAPAKWFLLVPLALTKAALVAMYFMHLRFETRTLAYIAITPLAIGTLLLFVLLPDHRFVEHKTADSAKVAAPKGTKH